MITVFRVTTLTYLRIVAYEKIDIQKVRKIWHRGGSDAVGLANAIQNDGQTVVLFHIRADQL